MAETRRLATIMALDMVGYSRATERDDATAAAAVRTVRDILKQTAESRGGRIFNSAGDGFMLEFQTATAGMEAALAALAAFEGVEPPIQVRIGLHSGEVIVEQSGDLLGHAVNIAARLQQRARPGEIILSQDVKRSMRGALAAHVSRAGEARLDKMSEALGLYVAGGERRSPLASALRLHSRKIVAAAAIAVVLIGGWFAFQAVRGGQSGASWTTGLEVAALTPLHAEAELGAVSARLSARFIRLLAAGNVPAVESSGQQNAASSRAELRLAGTIDRTNGETVVAPQLIDRRSGVVLWSTSLQRATSEESILVEEAAYMVVGILRCALDDRSSARGAVSAEVFSLLLNICDAGLHGRSDTLTLTRRLLAAAPDLPAAYANHAMSTAFAARELQNVPDQAAAMEAEARRLAERALAMSRSVPKAYGALASLHADDPVVVHNLLSQALEYNPDHPAVLSSYVGLLRSVGRVNASRELGDRLALIPDPRALFSVRIVAVNRAMNGDLSGAEQAVEQLEAVHPDLAADVRWNIAFWWDDRQRARDRLPELLRAGGETRATEQCLIQYLDQLDTARGRGLPSVCNAVQVDWRVRMLARQGDVDAAYALVDANLDDMRHYSWMFFTPEMSAFRRDARFMPLMAQLDLARYWRETGQWPDFCAEDDLPYDCETAARAT